MSMKLWISLWAMNHYLFLVHNSFSKISNVCITYNINNKNNVLFTYKHNPYWVIYIDQCWDLDLCPEPKSQGPSLLEGSGSVKTH